MKTRLHVLLAFAGLLLSLQLKSQILPGLVGNFGIDGDVESGKRLNGTFTAANTHDWFKKTGAALNAGIGMVDTAGNYLVKPRLQAGENLMFSKGQMFPKYSLQDGKLLYDTRFARDNIGVGGTVDDSTIYVSGAKNGMSPYIWNTNPTGSSVTDKVDIVDGYVHMRRNGNVINNTNPSHLMLMLGASTMGTDGNRYIDLELFKERLDYNYTTGIFSNSGPVATGGHSMWYFNPDGSILSFGDIDFSFAFNSSTVEEISIYIWVSKTTLETINPVGFDFAGNTEFYGDGNNPDFGYAKIIPNPGFQLPVWGSVNTGIAIGPSWGTNSKDLGAQANLYYSTDYYTGQFAEVGIDLTLLGLDPALNNSDNPCNPPFTRAMIKSRSSVDFNSALQDFTGPHIFLDAPVVPAEIITPEVLTCTKTTIELRPVSYTPGAYYSWSTVNGNILSNPDSSVITVNKPGKYYLSTSIVQGCAQNRDSTNVFQDIHIPTASIYQLGTLNTPYDTSMILLGGDETLSYYSNAFSSYQGLLWYWTGPAAFTSAVQNPEINDTGNYRLIVTHISNGCKDTATSYVINTPLLPVKLISFSGSLVNTKAVLNWKVAENEIASVFEIERSFNGNQFTIVAKVNATTKNGIENYYYAEPPAKSTGRIYYRLKMYDKSGVVNYSEIVVINLKTSGIGIELFPNPAVNKATVNFVAEKNSPVSIKIVNPTGQTVYSKNLNAVEGLNQLPMDISVLKQGMYFVEVINEGTKYISRLTVTR